jgi:hypothetical protein
MSLISRPLLFKLQDVAENTGRHAADFPLTDFYGTTRTFPGVPGAVATAP